MHDPILPTRSRARIAADNRAEITAWLDERIAELTASGMHADEARRVALAEFGDVDGARRYGERQDATANRRIRALLVVEELASDLRIAARTLLRTPTVTIVVMLTFALGLGVTTAVFSLVHAMLLRPLPYGDEATLVQLQPVENGVVKPGARHSAAALAMLRQRTSSFSSIAAIEGGNSIVMDGGDPEQIASSTITPDAFDALRSPVALGRPFSANEVSGEAGRVAILLDAFWRRRFNGDSSVIGRIIEVSGVRRRVIGVMPPAFRVPTYEQSELIMPRDLAVLLGNPINTHVRALRLFGRLEPGVSPRAAQADVDRVMRVLQTELPRQFNGIDARVVPIRSAVAGDAKPRLVVLMWASSFVLLIACANIAGILLARALARRHELAVRVALGAGRRRLIRQFLAEGAVLAIVGLALGLLFGQLGVGVLRRIATDSLPAGTTFSLEPRVLSFTAAAALITAVIASLIPALAATRSMGVAVGRDAGRASLSRGSRRLRLGLVTAQLAVSVVLLIGGGLLLRTLHGLAALDLGYDTEHTLTLRPQFTRPKTNAEQDAYYASVYAALRAVPGVKYVGGGAVPTSGQSSLVGLAVEGRAVESERLPEVRYTPASDDYFSAMSIPVVRGRAFNTDDRASAPWVAVVSQGLAKQLWPDGDPVGARVRPGPGKEWATIVGIVGDVRMGGMDAPLPSIYTSQRQDHWPAGSAIVVRADGDPGTLATSIRATVKRVDRSLVITNMRTLSEFRRGTPAIAERQLQQHLILAFALVALVVSAIGVFGVSAYAAEARRREFGIRIALGSPRERLLWLVLRDGALIAFLGAAIGMPVAWFLASRVRDVLYVVTPYDPLTAAASVGVLILVAVAASAVPARRAAAADPMIALRSD